MPARRLQDLAQHVGHAALLVPAVARFPAFRLLEACAIVVAGVFAVPGLLRVLAEAEWASSAAVIELELDAEDVEKKLVHFVAREDLVDHPQHILPIGT